MNSLLVLGLRPNRFSSQTPRALLSLLPASWGDDLSRAISFWDPVTHCRCPHLSSLGMLPKDMGP